MRRYIRYCRLFAFGMALATCSYAQSHQVSNHAPEVAVPDANDEHNLSDLPTRQLTFTAGDSVSGLKASPVIIMPMQCTSDGALFFNVLQPPSFMQQALYSVTPKASHGFAISAINDLHEAELTSFFPSGDHVSVLVRATRDTSPLSGEATVRQSAYRFFVALFNRQGEYLKSVQLEMHDVVPSHVAALSSGEYLVTGYDRANDLPRLYLVADDGQVIRTLVLPYNLGQYVPSADPNSGQGMMNHSRVLGSILMTPHGDEVLIWRRGGSGLLLSVGAHGSTREINLDVPKGLTLADVLPSDQLWVAHFQPAGHSPDQPQDNHQTFYYQFDPSDGSLTSKLLIRADSPEHAPALIACEEEGTFLSYQADDKGQLHILSAR